MITIKQIAEGLNVSPTTVSNVIHGNYKKVSPENVERISKRLKELNYIPNMGARMLAHGDSRIIGVVMNSLNNEQNQGEKYTIEYGPFNSTIFSALEREIRKDGYYMMFYVSKDVDEILNVMNKWNIDGMIVWGLEEESCCLLNERTKKPVVFIDCCFEPDSPCSNVGLYDCYGGYLAVRHLLENGHREIAFLTDTVPLREVAKERYLGYVQAFEEYGLVADEKSVIELSIKKDKRMQEYQKICIESQRFTALFFDSDYYAVEALDYLLDQGIRIPDDLSVVGFDDNVFSRIIRPQLTTVHQDVAEKAVQAVKLLREQIQNPEQSCKKIVLPVQLVVRETVKRIAED